MKGDRGVLFYFLKGVCFVYGVITLSLRDHSLIFNYFDQISGMGCSITFFNSLKLSDLLPCNFKLVHVVNHPIMYQHYNIYS